MRVKQRVSQPRKKNVGFRAAEIKQRTPDETQWRAPMPLRAHLTLTRNWSIPTGLDPALRPKHARQDLSRWVPSVFVAVNDFAKTSFCGFGIAALECAER